jgi:hypothetical protein
MGLFAVDLKSTFVGYVFAFLTVAGGSQRLGENDARRYSGKTGTPDERYPQNEKSQSKGAGRSLHPIAFHTACTVVSS